MSCENKFSLPKNTKIVRDPKGSPIGVVTSNPVVVNELERHLETGGLDRFGCQETVVLRASIVDGSVEEVRIKTLKPYPFDLQRSMQRLGTVSIGEK